MSTELEVPDCLKDKLTLTQFWGGDKRGICLQLTIKINNSRWDGVDYIQLTEREAAQLADTLRAWVIERVNKHNGIT